MNYNIFSHRCHFDEDTMKETIWSDSVYLVKSVES
jgi:hypothetical protein